MFKFTKLFLLAAFAIMLFFNNPVLAKTSPPKFLEETEKDPVYKEYLDNYAKDLNRNLKVHVLPDSWENYFIHARYTIYPNGKLSDLKIHSNTRNHYQTINYVFRPKYRETIKEEGLEFERIIQEIIIYTPREPFPKEFEGKDLNIHFWIGYIPYIKMQGQNWTYEIIENGKVKKLNSVIFIQRDTNPE